MAKLLEYYNGVQAGEWELGDEPVIIGRAQESQLILKDPSISRQHCLIRKREGRFTITDLNSNNGTFIDGKRIIQAVLVNTDKIGIGKYEMKFIDEKSSESPSVSGDGRRMFLAIAEKEKKDITQKVWKIAITGDGGPKRTIDMLKSDLLIGKSVCCDITLEKGKISDTHVLLIKQGNVMRCINVSEKSPLFINGKKAQMKESLAEEFTFPLGNCLLTVTPCD